MLSDSDVPEVVSTESTLPDERGPWQVAELQFVAARRRAALACVPFLRWMTKAEQSTINRLLAMAIATHRGVMGGALIYLTIYKRRELGFLVRSYTGFGLWEYMERGDGSLPVEDTLDRRRFYTLLTLEAWHDALSACEPFIDDMPAETRDLLNQALTALREETPTGERPKTFFTLPAPWRHALRALVLRCNERTVESFEAQTVYTPPTHPHLERSLFEVRTERLLANGPTLRERPFTRTAGEPRAEEPEESAIA